MLRPICRISLRSLLAFEAVARLGSFRDAAAEMGVTVSATSRLVAGLEEHVEHRLFLRDRRKPRLTVIGEFVFGQVTRPFADIDRALDSIVPEARGRRRVQICANPTLAVRWLVPRLGQFHAERSDVSVEVLTSPEIVDPRTHLADGIITLTDRVVEPLKGDFLFAEELVVVGSPLTLGPMAGESLRSIVERAPIFAVPRRLDQWRGWFALNGLDPGTFRATHVFHSTSLILPALIGGQGLGIVDRRFVEAELAGGSLIALPGEAFTSGLGYWLIYDGGRPRRSGFVSFATWLVPSGSAEPPGDAPRA